MKTGDKIYIPQLLGVKPYCWHPVSYQIDEVLSEKIVVKKPGLVGYIPFDRVYTTKSACQEHCDKLNRGEQ